MIRPPHPAQCQAQARGQNHRPHQKREEKFQGQFPVQSGVLPGNAAALHDELNHARQPRRAVRAQRHFHKQQVGRRAVGFRQEVLLLKPGAGGKVADRLQPLQPGQIGRRQVRFRNVGREGHGKFTVPVIEPHPDDIAQPGNFEGQLKLFPGIRQGGNRLAPGLIVQMLHDRHRIENLRIALDDLRPDARPQIQGRPGQRPAQHRQGQTDGDAARPAGSLQGPLIFCLVAHKMLKISVEYNSSPPTVKIPSASRRTR